MARAWSRRVASCRSSWITSSDRLACPGLGRLHRGGAAPRFVVDESMNSGVLAAQRARLVLAQLQLAEAHVFALKKEIAADHRLPDVEEVLDRLEGHHAADDPRQNSEDTRLGAALDGTGRRRLREQAAV